MPKTVKNIWGDIARFSNLALAYHRVRKSKKYDAETIAFYANLEENLFDLERRLLERTWKPEPFREFTVTTPRLRLVQAPAFADRVVHQAVMFHAGPVFERRFISDSYANRLGFGTHLASHRLRQFLRAASARWERPYLIKADIKSYFASIPHDPLLQRLPRLFADPGALWFFGQAVRGCGYEGKGLPIGSLCSQWLANLYLDSLDHFVKEDLGVKYYVRYMDDFVIVGESKAWCRDLLERVTGHVHGRQLAMNPKTEVRPLSRGVDFVGYRHWCDHTLPRKRTVKRARKQFKTMKRLYALGRMNLEAIRGRVASFTGYMRHCNGHRSLAAILGSFVLEKSLAKKDSESGKKEFD